MLPPQQVRAKLKMLQIIEKENIGTRFGLMLKDLRFLKQQILV